MGNNSNKIDSSTIFSMAKRRGFLWPSYEIYGGVAGFYDYGPLGSILRENIIANWRDHFIFQEKCAEIATPEITPEEVFKASGHVDEFKDFMVECLKCHSTFRADHLLSHLEINADNLELPELEQALKNNNITCPDCHGNLSEPRAVNLMFETNIGLGTPRHGYLRPETAQGMFVNFQNLFRYFRERLPFGAAQIGRGFRNEISPRQGMVRLREMTLAELEYFFNPEITNFDKVDMVLSEEVILVPEPDKELRMTIGEAIEKKIIVSEIMAYFIGRTKQFLDSVGLDHNKIRFRRHQENEMAHYAKECWDAEALTSFDWLELIGIANRSAYDLKAHITTSHQELSAFIPYEQPIEHEVETIVVDMKALGPLFRSNAGKVKTALEAMAIEQLKGKESVKITVNGEDIEVPNNCFSIQTKKEKVSGQRIIPNVLEPSFGIDRIFYTLLEHSYKELEPPADIAVEDVDLDVDEPETSASNKYRVLTFRPQMAPIKVGIFPLMPKDGLDTISGQINNDLKENHIKTYYDESGSIGRRYARMDEIGTPYCITVDYQTKTDHAVTIRDRDTHDQVRVKIDELVEDLKELIKGSVTLDQLRK